MAEKRVRIPAVRIAGEEIKKVLVELPRESKKAAHIFQLPGGGIASRVLIAGMLIDTWSNPKETIRGIKIIDPWGTSISLLASPWSEDIIKQIDDELSNQQLLMIMAKLSIYEKDNSASGEDNISIQYPKIEKIWPTTLDDIQKWKAEVAQSTLLRGNKVNSEEAPDEKQTVERELEEEFGEELTGLEDEL